MPSFSIDWLFFNPITIFIQFFRQDYKSCLDGYSVTKEADRLRDVHILVVCVLSPDFQDNRQAQHRTLIVVVVEQSFILRNDKLN
jgi:hypothetical protein